MTSQTVRGSPYMPRGRSPLQNILLESIPSGCGTAGRSNGSGERTEKAGRAHVKICHKIWEVSIARYIVHSLRLRVKNSVDGKAQILILELNAREWGGRCETHVTHESQVSPHDNSAPLASQHLVGLRRHDACAKIQPRSWGSWGIIPRACALIE